MTTQKAIEILERLRDVYAEEKHSEDIVTAIAFGIDSISIVGNIINDGFGGDDINDKGIS